VISEPQKKLWQNHEDLPRVISLSDCIFAFAMTLLVVDVRVPELANGITVPLREALIALAPKIVTYVLSFYLIATYWYMHQRLFRYIQIGRPVVVWVNAALLLFITFMPAATILLRSYVLEAGVLAIYAATISVTGFLMWYIWYYVSVVSPSLHPISSRLANLIGRRFLALPVLFGLSIPTAFVHPHLAQALWLISVFGQMWATRQIGRLLSDIELVEADKAQSLSG